MIIIRIPTLNYDLIFRILLMMYKFIITVFKNNNNFKLILYLLILAYITVNDK